MFDSPEKTTSSSGLKVYATNRLDVRGKTQIKGTGDDNVTAMRKETKIKVVKNKVAPPFKVAEVEIMFGEGISQTGELVKIATDLDIIKKSGAWFSYNDEKIGQGSEKAKLYLKEHPEVFAEIDHKVREKYGLIAGETTEGQTEEKAATKSSKAKKETAAESELVSLELDTIEIEE